MCDVSNEESTRLMRIGESSTLAKFPGHYGKPFVAVKLNSPEPGIKCLCTPHNAVFNVDGLPDQVVKQLKLESRNAMVTFRQGSKSKYGKDTFEFANGGAIAVSEDLIGIRIVYVAKTMEKYLADNAVAAQSQQPEVHPAVLQGGGGQHQHKIGSRPVPLFMRKE